MKITTNHMILVTITLLAAGFVFKRFWRRNGIRVLTFRRNLNSNETAFCAVCLEEIMEGDKFRRLPECKHCFHVECIDAWFESRSTCPLCRNDVGFVGGGGGGSNGQHEESGLVLCYFIWCLKIIVKIIDKAPLHFENSFPYGHTSTHIF